MQYHLVKTKKSRWKNFIITWMIVCFLLQDLLQTYIPVFQYLDEIVSVLLLALYLIRIMKTGVIAKEELGILALAALVILTGLLGNMFSGVDRSLKAVLMDIGNTFKFIFIYLGTLYFSPRYSSRDVIRRIAAVAKVYISILALFSAVNLVKDIGMSYELRYGLRSFCFVYGIPGIVINHCTYMLIIFMADRSVNKKKNTLFLLLDLLVMLSTLRSRGIGLVALFCMLYYLLFVMKKKRITLYLGVIVLVLGLIGASQLEMYFIDSETAPRALFLIYSIRLARSHFPIGMGFATFGSYAAANYYSPLYYTLNFYKRYGMGPEGNLFLSDNYWPTILGQFGVIGMLIFVVLLILYFRNMSKHLMIKKKKESRLIFYFVMLDALMSSIQSSYFSHYSMIALIFITMMCFHNGMHAAVGENGYGD